MTPREIARAKEIADEMRIAEMHKQNAIRAQAMLEKMSRKLREQEVVRINSREKIIG